MRSSLLLLPFLLCVGFSSCSSTEEEEIEPDYDNMVMVDEPDDWLYDEERDRKIVIGDLPDPQELIIIDPIAPHL